MIKLVYLIKKRQDLTDAAFETYWRESHARLVEELAPTLRAMRYAMSRRLDTVCNACVSNARDLGSSDYDGVIEIWWDSLEDYVAGAGSAAGIAAVDALVDAERRFVDFANSASFFSEEEIIFDTNQPDISPRRSRITSNSKSMLSNVKSTTALIE
ncbi:MAG: EthD domain-containing protein [Pseudomonadota bacterium]